jgi:hypothetical protein
MAMPKIGDKQNISRTTYTYASNGLWKGSDGSTKTRAEMNSVLATSTGAGAPPAAPSGGLGTGRSAPVKPGTWAGKLMYPDDLAEGNGDYITFEFYQYKPPYSDRGTGENLALYNYGYTDGSTNAKADGYPVIHLYMPEDISAQYASTWGGRDFGPLSGPALALAGNVLNATRKDEAKTAMASLGPELQKIGDGLVGYIGSSAIAAAMNRIPGMGGSVGANDILAATSGRILNPNTEVLYTGPNIRATGFDFTLVPRNKAEVTSCQKIIKTFKQASLPSIEGNMLNVPKLVRIKFMTGNKENGYIPKYKLCAIGGVDVNYTPNGSWSTFTDGSPTAMKLSLKFQELKLIYQEDIEKGY